MAFFLCFTYVPLQIKSALGTGPDRLMYSGPKPANRAVKFTSQLSVGYKVAIILTLTIGHSSLPKSVDLTGQCIIPTCNVMSSLTNIGTNRGTLDVRSLVCAA